jgi:hypothetical protein
MSIENTRAHVIASIWQAMAQSGVDLAAVPKEQQTALVESIADNLLVTVDNLLEVAQPAPLPDLEGDEKVLWTGRPFLSLTESYTVTSERVKVKKGLLGKDIENFELIRVQDLDFAQNISERMLGIGDLVIRGSDASHPELTLRNIRDPEKVYELVRRAWLEARKRYGLTFQEEM